MSGCIDWAVPTRNPPVSGDTLIEVELKDGTRVSGLASEFYWVGIEGGTGTIRRYRVIGEATIVYYDFCRAKEDITKVFEGRYESSDKTIEECEETLKGCIAESDGWSDDDEYVIYKITVEKVKRVRVKTAVELEEIKD